MAAANKVWVTVANPTVKEGVPGARTMADGAKFKFTLRRSGNLSSSLYADLSLSPGTAIENDDYVATLYTLDNGSYKSVWGGRTPKVTFASGQSEIDLYVFIRDDSIAESDKTLRLQITGTGMVSGSGGVEADSAASAVTVTIQDDDSNHSPVVNDSVRVPFSQQSATTGKPFTLKVPDTLFTDVDGDALGHNAYQVNGDSLPAWLSFDGTTFSGTPDTPGIMYGIRLTAYDGRGGITSTDFTLNVAPGAVTKDDYGSTASTAGACAIGTPTGGEIEVAGDKDWFAVTLEKGKGYRFLLKGKTGLPSDLPDPRLTVYGADNALVASGVSSAGGAAAEVRFTATRTGTYYVSAESTGSSTGAYSLTSEVDSGTPSGGTEFRGAVGDGIPTPKRGDGDKWYVSRDLTSGENHLGEDWNYDDGGDSDKGMSVFSIANGVVDKVGYSEAGWGNYIVFKHPLSKRIFINGETFDAVYSIYAHLQDLPSLKNGDAVKSGDQIGKIGNTGNSEGYHLHLGIATSGLAARIAGLIDPKNDAGEFIDNGNIYHSVTKSVNDYYINPSYFIVKYNSGEMWSSDFASSSLFSPDAYAAENPDLLNAYSVDPNALARHYIVAGRSEGRAASGFDANAYAANNPDLFAAYGLDAAALTRHYVRYGKNEHRTATGFDPYAYAALNPDLAQAFGANASALVRHYIDYGKNEHRAAAGFDPYAYAARNPDLFRAFGADVAALVAHYASQGFREGRVTTGFNPYAYAAKNADLYGAFGTNVNALVQHYVTSGAAEGRLAS